MTREYMTLVGVATATREELADEIAAAGIDAGNWQEDYIGDLRQRVAQLISDTKGGEVLRHSPDGAVVLVWDGCSAVRCASQYDEDTLPRGTDMDESEVEEMRDADLEDDDDENH